MCKHKRKKAAYSWRQKNFFRRLFGLLEAERCTEIFNTTQSYRGIESRQSEKHEQCPWSGLTVISILSSYFQRLSGLYSQCPKRKGQKKLAGSEWSRMMRNTVAERERGFLCQTQARVMHSLLGIFRIPQIMAYLDSSKYIQSWIWQFWISVIIINF